MTDKPPYFVHESAYVDDNVSIGSGTKIWHFVHVLSNTRIGKDCVLGQNVMAGPDVSIGDGCKIQNNVALYKGVELGDDVFCGPSCVFTNVLTPRLTARRNLHQHGWGLVPPSVPMRPSCAAMTLANIAWLRQALL
jgi:UDP-2-acetamido-3-amino-2,3-dideoxy-glucuronate N-acetyltransferase